jgi:hypothetical protein
MKETILQMIFITQKPKFETRYAEKTQVIEDIQIICDSLVGRGESARQSVTKYHTGRGGTVGKKQKFCAVTKKIYL